MSPDRLYGEARGAETEPRWARADAHRTTVESHRCETDPHRARGNAHRTKVESCRSEPEPIARVPDADGPKPEPRQSWAEAHRREGVAAVTV